MIYFSIALVVIEPLSALMLLALVMRFKTALCINRIIRVCLSMLAAGLIISAIGQAELLMNYRPPRTHSWIVLYMALNATIWSAYLTDLKRRYFRPNFTPMKGGDE